MDKRNDNVQMEQMKSQFINGFISQLAARYPSSELKYISERLTIFTNNYEIVKKTKEELPLADYYPECAEEYLDSKRMQGLAFGTLNNYRMYLKHFFKDVQIPIGAVKKGHVVSFLSKQQCGNRTKSHILTVLNTFFDWAAAEGYVVANPCKSIPKIKYQRQLPEHLTDMEVEMLRNACTTPREKAMVEFFYSTGCRISEVMNANTSDIDFHEGEIKIIGKGGKMRVVYLNPKTIIALEEYLYRRKGASNALFTCERKPYGRIKSKRIFEQAFEELGKKAGIKKHVHPHLLRHTSATIALEKGMPIQEVKTMLGHARMDTTLIYAEVADESVRRNHRKCIV